MSPVVLRTDALAKTFTLHLQGGVCIPVLSGVGLEVHAGECVVLSGPSGVGKSTLMRSLYGNYRTETGHILVQHRGEMVDLANADPRTILAVRHETLGYVSQFLRVVPRVPALDVVAEVLVGRGAAQDEARRVARQRTPRQAAVQCAANLRRAGHELKVWNRTTSTAEAWAQEHGATVAASPAEVAQDADVVFSMVVDGPQVQEVLVPAARLPVTARPAPRGSRAAARWRATGSLSRSPYLRLRHRPRGCAAPGTCFPRTCGPPRGVLGQDLARQQCQHRQ